MVSTSKSMSNTAQGNVGIEYLYNSISVLETAELEQFMQKIGLLIARRKTVALPEREKELLMAVNQPIEQKLQERYTFLSKKLEDETMTPSENKEFLKLVEKMEAKQVHRLQYLIELSHIRGVSLDVLMEQLHLNLPNLE